MTRAPEVGGGGPVGGGASTGGGPLSIPGSPGGLHTAAGALSKVATTVGEEGRLLATRAKDVVDAANWQGAAADAFLTKATNAANKVKAAQGPLSDMATAISDFASVVSWAQSQCQTTAQFADHASHYPPQDQFLIQSEIEQRSAEIWQQYQAGVQRAVDAISSAAAALDGQDFVSELTDLLITAFEDGSHALDFLGGVTTLLTHEFDSKAGLAGKLAVSLVDDLESRGVSVAETLQKGAGALDQELLQGFEAAEGKASWAANLLDQPWAKALGAAPSEDVLPGVAGDALSKVPYVGWLLTAADVGINLHDGKGVAYSIGQPLGNLVVGTAAAELTGALLASTAIPGWGEVVLAGAAAVAVTYGVDKGVSYVWQHRQAIEHAFETTGEDIYNVGQDAVTKINQLSQWVGNEEIQLGSDAYQGGLDALNTAGSVATGVYHGATHVASDVYHGASHVVHDMEPWNW